MISYRPWGSLRWLMPKLAFVKEWTFCGCISPEERSLGAFLELKKSNIPLTSFFSTVKDPESILSPEISSRIKELVALAKYNDNAIHFKEFDLLYQDYTLIYNYISRIVDESNKNIILDISCFPKRFFFPFIKFLINSKQIENFVVTSTMPEKYKLGKLAENYSQWDTLPFFGDLNENKKKDIVLFGVGHMPMASLEPIQDICASSRLQLFFPFPGHPQSFMHTWNFVYEIKRRFHNKDDVRTSHINAADVSELFDNLMMETNQGADTALLAPYGPKPFSLAMAIFASKFATPVYYTQPKLYYPNYSSGIGIKNGTKSITAYCIRLQGNHLY